MRPTITASSTWQCCKLSYSCSLRGSVLTCSSERTMQLLCLSGSPSSPAPGEGDTIPPNRVSPASPLLFAPNPPTPVRCLPQQDIHQGTDCFRGGPDIAELSSHLCHLCSTVPYRPLRSRSRKREVVQRGGCRVRSPRIPDSEGSGRRAQCAPWGHMAGRSWLLRRFPAAT